MLTQWVCVQGGHSTFRWGSGGVTQLSGLSYGGSLNWNKRGWWRGLFIHLSDPFYFFIYLSGLFYFFIYLSKTLIYSFTWTFLFCYLFIQSSLFLYFFICNPSNFLSASIYSRYSWNSAKMYHTFAYWCITFWAF